jgi:hypothetical protein
MNNLVVTENVSKAYPLPKGTLWVFEGLDFVLERGDLVAVMGASGVGKTTFLNSWGLDRPTEGTISSTGGYHARASGKSRLRNENRVCRSSTISSPVHQMFLPPDPGPGTEGRRALAILKEVLREKAHRNPAGFPAAAAVAVAGPGRRPQLLLADSPPATWTGSRRGHHGLIQDLHVRRGSLRSSSPTAKIAAFCRSLCHGGKTAEAFEPAAVLRSVQGPGRILSGGPGAWKKSSDMV